MLNTFFFALSDFGLPIFFISALIPPVPTLYFVYHKLGFVDTNTEQLTDGIRYTPMKYVRNI
ncbi:MAG: GNAT family N-acetyltransferase [Eisenbergiella sp.]